MNVYSVRKSTILLIILSFASVIQYVMFHLSTGTILLLLMTTITALHIGIKKLKKRYPGKLLETISKTYRVSLMIIGILSIIILILVIRPIKECRQSEGGKVQQASHMIILGAGLDGDQVSKRLKLRLDKALEALELNPELIVIVSGGQGSDELISEAEAMKRYLLEAGIEEEKIIAEDKSTSTYENFLYSKSKTDELNSLKNILIVTSDFHVFRSQFIANRLGWSSQALCSKSEIHVISNYMIREIPAVMNDFLKPTKK